MYSIVLMAAMGGTPDAPGFNGFFRDLFNGNGCSGCYGCNGSARYSCFGGCGGGAHYASCNGCNGGVFSGLGTRVRRLFDFTGCCGSHSYGCVGSAYSCYGSGAYACFGGPPVMAYNPVINGGLSCAGGPVPFAPPPVFDGMAPTYPPPGIPYAPPEVAPPPGGQFGGAVGVRPAGGVGGTTVGGGPTVQQTGRATVVIRLPADARLYADNAPLQLTGGERKFVSPELPAGQEFVYRFKVEYERDGEVVSVTKKVAVRAGGSVAVEFADLTLAKSGTGGGATPTGATPPVTASPVSNPAPGAVPSVLPGATGATPAADAPASPGATPGSPAPGADRAMITVTLPPGATLYVDDRKSPSTNPVRQFATPPLPTGREFAYLMKAEVVRDGRPEYLIQKVTFRAGERVTVDFTALGK